MVERPIKKSDRQAIASNTDVTEAVKETEGQAQEASHDEISPSPSARNTPRPILGKEGKDRGTDRDRDRDNDRGTDRDRDRDRGRGKGRGKGNQREESRPSNVNPALMRGPKPTKPKPPVLQEPEPETTEVSDTVTEEETTADE